MEEVPEIQKAPVKPKTNIKKIIRNCLVLLFALLFAYIHYRYVETVHENEYYFSHMSELERELTLHSELGFYYSYYKTVVQERPFVAGITKIMYDRLVEYPKVVNAFNRFNILPEVILGGTYLYFEEYLNSTRVCHMVNRGQDVTPVRSCVGIGEPIMFYLQAVWVLAGFFVAVLFLFATDLSGQLLGGIIAVLQYFGNHVECTRVMWIPNERENFAAPLLFLQMYFITLQLRAAHRKCRTSFRLQVSIFILNCLCLLFWQFSQFIFLTQTAIFFVMEQLKIIDLKTLCVFLHSHFCGIHMVLLLQGNDLLKTSLYTAFFLVVSCYSLFFSSLRVKVQTKLDFLGESWLILLRIGLVIISSIHVKKILNEFFGVQEDNHIWDLLYSKFSDFKSFHTLLYTCSAAFDFLPLDYFKNVLTTGLLPIVVYGIVNVVSYWILNGVCALDEYKTSKTRKLKKRTKECKDDKMAADNKMADFKNGANESDTDDSGIENSDPIGSNNDLDILYSDKAYKDPELPVDRFVYFFKNMNVEPEIFYNISQLVVFGVMAVLFMRLKLLLSAQLCIVSALAWNAKYHQCSKLDLFVLTTVYDFVRLSILILSLLALGGQGYSNINREVASISEFSDADGEGLMTWINRETARNAVFAGPLPISATVMLTTRRPIVTHPHYEHKDNRDRAYAVYKMYGRFSPQELYQELTKLQVAYLILDRQYCYQKNTGKEHCGTFTDIWDAEMPSYAGRPALCKTLFEQDTDHFYRVYSNRRYSVFRVHDLSLLYMPRVFDT